MCLLLLEVCYPHLNLDRTFHLVIKRCKEFRYYLFYIGKSRILYYRLLVSAKI